MENTRENWMHLLGSKMKNQDFSDDGSLIFFFHPYSFKPELGMLVLMDTETKYGASIGKMKKPEAVTRVYSDEDMPQYTAMFHAN